MIFTDPDIKVFLLVLARISGVFLFTPFFRNRSIPLRAKVGLSVFLSFFVWSFLPKAVELPHEPIGLSLLIVRETLFGFVLGTLVAILFTGVQAAGSVVSYQMGFGLISSYDPDAQGQGELVGQIKNLFALLLFLIFDGHHRVLEALVKSYEILPIGAIQFTGPLLEAIIARFGTIFSLAIRMAAPVIAALWVTNVCLALLVRFIPQMNIFMVDFPIKISVGLACLGLTLPYFSTVFETLLTRLWKDMYVMIGLMKG